LTPGTFYYFEITATDPGSNMTVDDNGGFYYTFQTWQLNVYFMDDVESGAGNWTYDGLWHVVDAGSSCNEHHSADHSWYYGQDPPCDYDIGDNWGTLSSEIIDLTGTSQAEYHVWYWFDGESSTTYDTMAIQIEVVGGATSELYDVTAPTDWQEFVGDLAPYVGNQVRLHFFFDTYDSIANAYQGVYVDDIQIIASEPCDIPTPTPNICLHTGDVDFSGNLSAGDAQMAFQIALFMISPTYEQACAADCDGDGNVTAGDAQQIFLAALGMGSCTDPI